MGNNSKEYWAELNQSINPSHPKLKVANIVESREEKDELGQTKTMWKLKETIARCKEQHDQEEKLKIQQLGEHLEKIEKCRVIYEEYS